MKHHINLKLYSLLLTMSITSTVLLLPYAFTLQADTLAEVPIALPILAIMSVVQSSVIFALCIYAGLFLATRVGLHLPVYTHYIEKKKLPDNFPTIVKESLILGIVVAIAIYIADSIFSLLQVSLPAGVHPPIWQGFLASFYGGIAEEVFLRLFLMTMVVWIFSLVLRKKESTTSPSLMWGAILISAIIFGIGHLPATAAISDLTTGLIIRAVVLNGIGGIVFGWLYWKRSLASAMIAHFSTDIMLHVFFVGVIMLFI